jgi:hypothetical protein
MNKEVAGYIGSFLAIAFGAAILWFTPTILQNESATVGLAVAFAAGGFAGLGATVAIPSVRASAMREGAAIRATAAARRTRAPRAVKPATPVAED